MDPPDLLFTAGSVSWYKHLGEDWALSALKIEYILTLTLARLTCLCPEAILEGLCCFDEGCDCVPRAQRMLWCFDCATELRPSHFFLLWSYRCELKVVIIFLI